MKKTAPDGAVSGMPAIRETGPGKNLQAITVSTHYPLPTVFTPIIFPPPFCTHSYKKYISPRKRLLFIFR
ncbi:hypothetical protein FSY54_11595 [Escherichia coli]|nr:hypothetical protein [Escherichia coli]